MNEQIIEEISNTSNIKISSIQNVLKLLEEGNTIPFIARYRKEVTGNLNEEQIREISEVYEYQVSLQKRNAHRGTKKQHFKLSKISRS